MSRILKIDKFLGYDQHSRLPGAAHDGVNFDITPSGSLIKRSGLVLLDECEDTINSIWAGELNGSRILVYIAGNTLYGYNFASGISVSYGTVTASDHACMFPFDGKLYILTDADYYVFDGISVSSVVGYVPLISVATTPDGAGTSYEAINMLSSRRKQLFSADGSATEFKLAEKNINTIVHITVNGTTVGPGHFTVDLEAGKVTFDSVVPQGINNVEITYQMPSDERSVITACKCAMLFGSNADERIFLWNNPNHPCRRFHSELADGVPAANYFPVTAYTVIGKTAITDIVQQYDKQLIFTADSAYYSYCEIKTSVNGSTYASFPVYPLNPSKGNLLFGTNCTMNGKPVTLCRDGLNVWEETDVETEKNAVCFSHAINDLIKPIFIGEHTNALLFNRLAENELIFASGSYVYVYNYLTGTWCVWSDIGISSIAESNGILCIASGKKLYTLAPTAKTHTMTYCTPYIDLDSLLFTNIKSLILRIKGGYVTEGTVTAAWHGKSKMYSVTNTFSVPAALYGQSVKIELPLYIPLATGIQLTFECASSKEVEIEGAELICQ